MGDEIRTTAEAVEADVMPRLYEVHCDPDATNANDQPLPKNMQAASASKKSPAQWAYERLALYIKNFEEKLDNEHEVAMGFAGGDAGVLRIEGMGYFDPDVITFYGSDPTGARTQLIQHVTQLNVLLRALPKAAKQAAPNRIGFRLTEALDEALDETTDETPQAAPEQS